MQKNQQRQHIYLESLTNTNPPMVNALVYLRRQLMSKQSIWLLY